MSELVASQLTHFFALLLWGGAALAMLGGLPPLAFAIVVIIVVNAAFAFVQEYRAGRAAEKLRDLLPRRATVIRDGTRQIVDAYQPLSGALGQAPRPLVGWLLALLNTPAVIFANLLYKSSKRRRPPPKNPVATVACM